jgi:hypothetical protein
MSTNFRPIEGSFCQVSRRSKSTCWGGSSGFPGSSVFRQAEIRGSNERSGPPKGDTPLAEAVTGTHRARLRAEDRSGTCRQEHCGHSRGAELLPGFGILVKQPGWTCRGTASPSAIYRLTSNLLRIKDCPDIATVVCLTRRCKELAPDDPCRMVRVLMSDPAGLGIPIRPLNF